MSSCSPPHKFNFNKTASSTCGSFITASQTQHYSTNNKFNFVTNLNTTKNKLFTKLIEQNRLHPNKTNSILNSNITNKFALKTSSPKIKGTQFPTISRDVKLNNLSSIHNSSPQTSNNNNNINNYEHNNNNLTIIEKFFNNIERIKQYTNLSLKGLKKSQSTLNLRRRTHNLNNNNSNMNNNNVINYNNQDIINANNTENESKKEIALTLKAIKIKPEYQFQSERHSLLHLRTFSISSSEIHKNAFHIYSMPSYLKQSQLSKTSAKIQLATIIDKSILILDNISYFKSQYMFTGNFQKAFKNLNPKQKASFNKTMEDICTILMKLPPLLMKHFYDSLDQILYCAIPDLTEECKKKISNEDECMKENYKVFIDVSNYYTGCVEVFKILTKKISGMKYNRNTYFNITLLLDIARFNSSSLISFAKNYIEKMKEDIKMLNNVEENLHLKKKKKIYQHDDINERLRSKDKKRIVNENEKLGRIIAALNMEKERVVDFKDLDNKYYLKESLLNLSVITNMMGYIDKPIREKIIAQRVVERYKENELNSLKEIEDKNK